MAVSSAECRRRARLCFERANDPKHKINRRSWIGIAANWEKLAEALQSPQPTRSRGARTEDSITLHYDNYAGVRG